MPSARRLKSPVDIGEVSIAVSSRGADVAAIVMERDGHEQLGQLSPS